MADAPRRKQGGKTSSQYFADLYDKWSIPISDEDGSEEVTSLHDGLDWVQVHAPRSFFEGLAEALEAGDTGELEKWLLVWAMPRKEPDPRKCGAPTRNGHPCHHDRPCRHHPRFRRSQ